MDLSYSLFHSIFSELIIIPYSILLDIHYSFSSSSSNFSYIDDAIRLINFVFKISQSHTVEIVVSQTELFLGSYALHTDPIVRGNLVCQCVSVSVCHFEDEKIRDTKTSGR